jgi:hypothetical protein
LQQSDDEPNGKSGPTREQGVVSLAMIDATYGHLAPDDDERERALLDAYDLGAAAEGASAR